jgi:hypothetical protein
MMMTMKLRYESDDRFDRSQSGVAFEALLQSRQRLSAFFSLPPFAQACFNITTTITTTTTTTTTSSSMTSKQPD